MAIKKSSKTKKTEPRRPKVKTSVAEQAQTIAELRQELQDYKRQFIQALEQQTATSDILDVIASSPDDLTPVLETVARNAARLCEARSAQVFRTDGSFLRLAANFGELPAGDTRPITRGTVTGRAVIERRTIHADDPIQSAAEFPDSTAASSQARLATPLLREGVVVGVIGVRRIDMRPFTEGQIKLVETFAKQAVIAIENVGLFKELQERNSELREALEHQTATSEVLGIISRSPTDVQPVLDAIVESAARVCGIDDVLLRLRERNIMVPRAHFGSIPIGRVEISSDEPSFPWMREHGSLHIPDARAQNDFPMLGAGGNARTYLIVPLHQQGELIGTPNARRTDLRPFTPAQIKLLETFADQAVIALENVRLFHELKESLEHQTATSQILGVIASSPTDIQPVLDVVAENAARLCEAKDAVIFRVDGDMLHRAAAFGPMPGSEMRRPISRGSVPGRTVSDKQTIHVRDMSEAEAEIEFPETKRNQQITGTRTILATPLLREGVSIGTITVRRQEVRPFTDKQIKLLEALAAQAVIAIENVRLFKELQERNAELREALEHQTATSEVLSIISGSPTDVQPVLDAIVESAARVCGIDDVVLRLIEGNITRPQAHFGPIPVRQVEISIDEPRLRWVREHGTLHVPDMRAQNDFPIFGVGATWHTGLYVPLRQQGEFIGLLAARRTEVRPFAPAQIKLLETFADQAVIAIENVRLFQELKEALEQQTATSEILGVIASSPTDLQPVFKTILANAVHLCGNDVGALYRFDGEYLRLAASHKVNPGVVARTENRPVRPGKETAVRRAALERRTIHVPDVRAAADFEVYQTEANRSERRRSTLAVPLLKEDTLLGVIVTSHYDEVKPFTDNQIKLVETFADQAVIAIENVRLF
jgi:GAF domain-containing protein